MFIYNCHSGVELRVATDEEFGSSIEYDKFEINPIVNSESYNRNYYIIRSKKLINAVQKLSEYTIVTSLLGFTILFINFSDYISRNQYHLFVMEFNDMEEFKILEDYLQLKLKSTSFSSTSLFSKIITKQAKAVTTPPKKTAKRKITTDIANIDSKISKTTAISQNYSMKALAKTYVGKAPMSSFDFNVITTLILNKQTTENTFVEMLHRFHPLIVQGVYTLISLDKTLLNIQECRSIFAINELNYIMRPIVQDSNINQSDYWYQLPVGASWFAFKYNGSNMFIKRFNYISRRLNYLFESLKIFVDIIVVGFIVSHTATKSKGNDNKLYIVRLDDLPSDWNRVYNIVTMYNLPNIFNITKLIDNSNEILGLGKKKKIHFVRQNCTDIFRFN